MKKIFLFSFVIFISLSQAQTNLFTDFDFVVLGGINSINAKNIGPSLIIEARTNLTQNLFLKASTGFSKIYKEENYLVKTYSEREFLEERRFFTSEYDVKEKTFDIIPFSVGLQYSLKINRFSPYILSDFTYNDIETKIIQSNNISRSYSNYEDVPVDFRVKHKENFIYNSLSISLGVGTKYTLINDLCLDFRYFYNHYFQIKDTHQFMVGLSL
ncbi:MAG TPA: outer membrane beta-barrel protein [Ignavibacteriaceae bacterium]|nr:outer membrane beta-barrel protein [Ignavibacteriaceae bacterium]